MNPKEFNGIPRCWLKIDEDLFVHPQLKAFGGTEFETLCQYSKEEARVISVGWATSKGSYGYQYVDKKEFDRLIENTPFLTKFHNELSHRTLYVDLEDQIVAKSYKNIHSGEMEHYIRQS